ncbi:MAG: copper chaperone PCu(A)C [Proteobacteria bacterium]|nr:copper chaperone PCu(A)C [Pseudomonadota bacterium]
MSLAFSHPWARAANKEGIGGGYFAVTNNGAEGDRLIGASSPAAESVELHAIRVKGPAITMALIERGIVVPHGQTITLKPRGYHLLMKGLKAPLQKGAKVPVTLVFEKAGSLPLDLVVEEPGPVGNEVPI